MLKTTVIACLIALPLLTTYCFNNRPAYADDKPTQQHQLIYLANYFLLKRTLGTGGQPVVQAKLNGTQPATLVLDTGSFNVLSPEMAKQLNLKVQPALLDDGKPFVWKGKQDAEVRVAATTVGHFSFYQSPFYLLEDQDFMLSPVASSDDTHFDGIIGIGMLQHTAMFMDGQQDKLGFCLPGNLSIQQVNQLGLTHPYVVPMTQREGKWYVEAHLTNNGVSATENLLLDTGSNFTKASDITADHLRLKILDRRRVYNAYNDKGGVGTSSVDRLCLGNLVLLGTSLEVGPVSDSEPPLLGMDILSGYRVLIDFPGKKMYLQPNTATVPTITIKPQTPSVPVGNAGH